MILCFCFLFHSPSCIFPPHTCQPGYLFLAAWFPAPTTTACTHKSTPTSVPQCQLPQFNSSILTITTFPTQYSPFLFTYIHTITYLPASLPSKQPPPPQKKKKNLKYWDANILVINYEYSINLTIPSVNLSKITTC